MQNQLDRLLAAHHKGDLRVSLYSKDLPSCLHKLYESYRAKASPAAPAQESVFTASSLIAAKGCSCRCCGLAFSGVAEQQAHFQSEAHLLVLRRSMQKHGSDVAGAAEKEDGAEEEDGSSGSSSDGDEALAVDTLAHIKVSSAVFAEGVASRVFGKDGPQYSLEISACAPVPLDMLVPAALVDSCCPDDDEVDADGKNPFVKVGRCISSLRDSGKLWAVFILRSGKFAGAVFDCGSIHSSREADPLVHKVFKRYTVRASAGGSQSSHDNQGRNAKSAGAMLRRYNEQALKEDVRDLLRLWSDHLDTCFRIVVSASKVMRGVLMDDDGGASLLSKADPRLLHAPFAVRDVTFEQTKAVLARCTQVVFRPRHLREQGGEDLAAAPAAAPVLVHEKVAAGPASTSRRVATAADEPETLSLLRAVRAADMEAVEAALISIGAHPLGAAYLLALPEDDQMMLTPLHVASELGAADIVHSLLLAGCAVDSVDARGRYPFFLSKDKATRDAFRRYRGVAGEGAHDFERAGVPPAITAEGEEQRVARERERKKQRALKKKEQKVREEKDRADAERMLQLQQQQELQRREQERLNAGNCHVCSASLYEQKLSVFDKLVCSSACVAVLRRRLAADAAEARFSKK